MSMDLTPLIYGRLYYEAQGYQVVSLVFGLVVLVGAYLVDRRTEEDYAFWGYLFGMFAFWAGLTLLEGGSEIDWSIYGLINTGLILLSVLLQRRVFVVFGAAGVFGYVGASGMGDLRGFAPFPVRPLDGWACNNRARHPLRKKPRQDRGDRSARGPDRHPALAPGRTRGALVAARWDDLLKC